MLNEKRVGQFWYHHFLFQCSNLSFVLQGSIVEGDWRSPFIVNPTRLTKMVQYRMDQAASVMSHPSSALYITFFPSLTASPVPLPPRAVFIVANSLKVADKVLSARRGYNLRVIETLVAARVLANSLRVYIASKEKITLREVVDRYKSDASVSDEALDHVLQFLLESNSLDVLKPKGIRSDQFGVTMDEMIEMCGMSKELFKEVYLSWVDSE